MSHQVMLCQMQLARMPAEADKLTTGLTELGVQVQRMQCLSLCFPCSSQIVARVDGMPMAAPNADAFLADVKSAIA